jgi:hypothetical protein
MIVTRNELQSLLSTGKLTCNLKQSTSNPHPQLPAALVARHEIGNALRHRDTLPGSLILRSVQSHDTCSKLLQHNGP